MARVTVAQLNARIAELEAKLASAESAITALNDRLALAKEHFRAKQRVIDDLQTVVTHQKAELDLYQMTERPSRAIVTRPETGEWPIIVKGGVPCYKIREGRITTYRPVHAQ